MSTKESTEIWPRHSNLGFPVWVILASTHQFFFYLGAYLKIGPWTWMGQVWCLDSPEAMGWFLIGPAWGPLCGHICPCNARSPDKDPLLISHDVNPKLSSWNTKLIGCVALALLPLLLAFLFWRPSEGSSWDSPLLSGLPAEPCLFLELWPASSSNHSTIPSRWAVPLVSGPFSFGPRFLGRTQMSSFGEAREHLVG